MGKLNPRPVAHKVGMLTITLLTLVVFWYIIFGSPQSMSTFRQQPKFSQIGKIGPYGPELIWHLSYIF